MDRLIRDKRKIREAERKYEVIQTICLETDRETNGHQ